VLFFIEFGCRIRTLGGDFNMGEKPIGAFALKVTLESDFRIKMIP